MERLSSFFSENWLSLTLIAVVVAAFLLLRTSPTPLADERAFHDAITGGRPTLVEFYSNY